MAATARYNNGTMFDNPRDVGEGHRSENSFTRYPLSTTILAVDFMAPPTNPSNSISGSELDSLEAYSQTSRQSEVAGKPLTTRECIELFHETVESSRQAINRPMSHEQTPEQLRPTLTLEMSRKRIQQIPSEVVQIIRRDVERYMQASLPNGSC